MYLKVIRLMVEIFDPHSRLRFQLLSRHADVSTSFSLA